MFGDYCLLLECSCACCVFVARRLGAACCVLVVVCGFWCMLCVVRCLWFVVGCAFCDL